MRIIPSNRHFANPTPRLRRQTAEALLDVLLSAHVPARYADFERGRQLLARTCGRDRQEYALAERELQRGLKL